MTPKVLIAEDEPTLAEDLRARLMRLWPEAGIVGVHHDGETALAALRTEVPDVAFLDIRMPGLSGLAVARERPAACAVAFVTAYDAHAVEAFEQAAVDYVLKPVRDDRLAQTVARLRERLSSHDDRGADLHRVLSRLDELTAAPRYLTWLRVAQGEEIRLVPVGDVLYFAAADKYTLAVTRDDEAVLRTPIKDLAGQLDPDRFWRIHRGRIVNVAAIASVHREFGGRLALRLHGCDAVLRVSRAYTGQFRQM